MKKQIYFFIFCTLLLAVTCVAQEIKVGQYKMDVNGQEQILTVFHSVPKFGKTYFAGYVLNGSDKNLVFGILNRMGYLSKLSYQQYLSPAFSVKCRNYNGTWTTQESKWAGEQSGEGLPANIPLSVYGTPFATYTPEANILEKLLQSSSVVVGGKLIASSSAPILISQFEDSCLLNWSGVKVLKLKGSYRDMGYAHGMLMRQQVQQNCNSYINFAASKGVTQQSLLGIYKTQEAYIPQGYKDEMAGMAQASGVALDKIQACHAIPTVFHCTGIAAWGQTTQDMKVYHTRSLDYPLNIGTPSVQENAVIIYYEPVGVTPYLIVGWSGSIGCVTGMNSKSISVGEMGSPCKDEDYRGLPMWFMLRHILEKASTLEEATKIIENGPRTCGFNFIIGDGLNYKACIVEATRNNIRILDNFADDIEPHFSIPNAVRRTNHFVNRDLALTQRNDYHPHAFNPVSWLLYQSLGYHVYQNMGKYGPELMIASLKIYPPSHDCHHQAVFCPVDLKLWVSFAKKPGTATYIGAQNFPFVALDMQEIAKYIPPQPENN